MNLRLPPSALLPIAAACLTACETTAAVPAVAVRDSAGIRIIESSAPVWREGEAWALSPTPTIEIGVAEGDLPYELSRVVGATRLSNGSIAIGNGGTSEIRFFDADGRHLRTVGRAGAGPGEYEHMRKLMSCGPDSVAAFDLHWQMKVYDASGELRREMRLLQPGTQRTPYALGCSAGGHLVMTGWGAEPFEQRLGFYQATSPVFLLSPDGEGMLELGEFVSSERIGTERGSGPHPLGRSTVLAVSEDEIFVGTAESPEVRTYGFDGALRRLLRAPPRDLAVSDADVDRFRRDQLEVLPERVRPEMERQLNEMPMPDSFPAYSELLLDREGNVWIRHFARLGAVRPRWGVFDAGGNYLGELETPADFRIFEIGSDYVLGVHRDELDVERVRVYALNKPTSP